MRNQTTPRRRKKKIEDSTGCGSEEKKGLHPVPALHDLICYSVHSQLSTIRILFVIPFDPSEINTVVGTKIKFPIFDLAINITMELLSVTLFDNVWNIATALLIMAVYCAPAQCWKCLHSIKQRCSSKQQQDNQQSPSTPPTTKHARKVTILSPLPHPPTDTTEVSEETEASFDERYELKEYFQTPPPLSTPSKSKPVKVVGKPVRLAGIPESPCPALNSSLKLKRKLLRHDAACQSSSVSGGASTGSGRRSHYHHRRSHTAFQPQIPTRTPLRRFRSVDDPALGNLKRDVFLLNRLSEQQVSK